TAGAGHELVDAVEREQERAGKDVFLDKINPAAELFVAGVGAGDELQGGDAGGFEHAVEGLAKGGQVAVAEGFHHFDGDDRVVAAVEVAEGLQARVHAVGESGGGDASGGEVVLFFGQRERGDAAAVVGGGVEGPAAPAGADFEHVVVGGEAEVAAEGVVLFVLGGF